jgi:O-antigen ligase
VWLIVLSSVVPVANGLGELAAGPTYARVGTTLKSLRGPFPHPNYFAFYLMVVLTLAVVLFIESRSLARKAGVGLLIGLGTICLFFTYTRSAWIGFALALVAIGALRYRRLLVVAVLGLALAAFVAPGATRKAQQRFGDLTSQSEASDRNSWSWRVDQWSAMLPYGFDRPLAGQGWDSYSRLTVRKFGHSNLRYPTIQFPAVGVYSAVGFTAHNDYVKDFVELGAPGLVLWVLSLVGLAVVAARARRLRDISGVAVAVLAVVIAVMLVSASDNLQGYTVVLTYVFALCGGLAGVAAASAARTGSEPAPAAALPPHAEAPEAAAEDAESVAGVTTSDSRPDPGPAPASVTERVRVGLARFASRVRRPR